MKTVKKNMFQHYIDKDQINPVEKSSREEKHNLNDSTQEETDSKDNHTQKSTVLNKYEDHLRSSGYVDDKILATASVRELHVSLNIPDEHAEQLIRHATKTTEFEFQSAAQLLHQREQMDKISTGSTALDTILGGGIEANSITEFYGSYTSGKTQVCMQLAFNAALSQEKGGLEGEVIYIDTEGSFRPERIMQMALDLDTDYKGILERIIVGRAYNSDIQLKLTDNVFRLAKEKNIKLLIIDSITATFRSEFMGKGNLYERQQKLNQHIRQLSRIADLLNIAVVITNQVSAVIDGYETTITPIGGNILAHGSTHRLQFSKSPKHSGIRFAKLIASPSLPNANASFLITENGIADIDSFNEIDNM